MKYIHEASDYHDLIEIVAERHSLSVALVEKDYWVVHSLWSLQQSGFEFWFKGGTSLSKGFDLIERFSEDLDLKVAPGKIEGLSLPGKWSSAKRGKRKAYFQKLKEHILVAGASIAMDEDEQPDTWRSCSIEVHYPGRHLKKLPVAMRPFVLLELGDARVLPCVSRNITSFIHDELLRLGLLGEFVDTRANSVKCLHPLVTLIEKLCAISSRFSRQETPAKYVRHYEDAERILRNAGSLPQLNGYSSARELLREMRADGDGDVKIPVASDLAFNPSSGEQWDSIRRALEDIGGMYWGERETLEKTCSVIRGWIRTEIE